MNLEPKHIKRWEAMLRTALRGIYGTNAQMELEEERVRAVEAISRMNDEACQLKDMSGHCIKPAKTIEEALAALAQEVQHD